MVDIVHKRGKIGEKIIDVLHVVPNFTDIKTRNICLLNYVINYLSVLPCYINGTFSYLSSEKRQ